MVPKTYQPVLGDRVCLWGRWIIDAGHNDFHTEIHPPLLMVTGHAQRSQFQPPQGRTRDATVCRILARPYLVSQNFNGHGIVGHLLDEMFKAASFRSGLVEAHPKLMPTPFVGQNFMIFKIRPPTPRVDARDELWVTYDLTRRSRSVAIELLRGSDDSVRVLVVLNDASYDPPPEPPRHKKKLKLPKLVGLDPEFAAALTAAMNVFFPVIPPHLQVILNRGIETHTYNKLPAPGLGKPVSKKVAHLGAANVPIDTSHPFPVAGTITLEWKRYAVAPPPGPTRRGQ
jgi:hypothetical protein